MKVVIAEKISDKGVRKLKEAGFEVDSAVDLPREELLEKVKDADALIVRSGTKVDKELLAAAPSLKIIGRAGIGVDNIDVSEATRRGIIVANAPQSNIISAAEHTIALLLSLARNIPQANTSLKRCEWNRSKFQGIEVNGKVLGIIGLGRVGSLVAQKAQGLGMKVIAYDPYVPEERFAQVGVERAKKLEDLLKKSDFISLHLPKNPETEGLLGEKEFQMMKDGVRIINTARGGLYKEETLVKFLKNGKVGGAAIDVFEEEPCTESPLFEFENVIVTPHLGASTKEAQDKAGLMIADQVIAGLTGGFVSTAVNIPAVPAEALEAVRPYLSLAEIMGKLFSRLSETQPSLIEVEFAGEIATLETKPLTLALLKGIFEPVVEEPVTYVNALLLARDRGVEIRESKTPVSREYVNLITMKSVKDSLKIAGTIFGRGGQPRIVQLYDYEVDVVPSKYMLIVHNLDVPGMIGKLGTLLGEHGINIGRMQFGRKDVGGEAVSILSLDNPLTPEIVKKVESLEGVSRAKFITL
jgi:D-3-phosphoglycerate dehydrogenase